MYEGESALTYSSSASLPLLLVLISTFSTFLARLLGVPVGVDLGVVFRVILAFLGVVGGVALSPAGND